MRFFRPDGSCELQCRIVVGDGERRRRTAQAGVGHVRHCCVSVSSRHRRLHTLSPVSVSRSIACGWNARAPIDLRQAICDGSRISPCDLPKEVLRLPSQSPSRMNIRQRCHRTRRQGDIAGFSPLVLACQDPIPGTDRPHCATNFQFSNSVPPCQIEFVSIASASAACRST